MYQLNNDGSLLRELDGVTIPLDINNRDYREYLEWVAAGNEPTPYVAPPAPVPQAISRFQAMAALDMLDLIPAVEAALDSAPSIARLAWQHAQEFYRDSPTILALAPAIGLTEHDLDELFRVGSQIQA